MYLFTGDTAATNGAHSTNGTGALLNGGGSIGVPPLVGAAGMHRTNSGEFGGNNFFGSCQTPGRSSLYSQDLTEDHVSGEL